MLTPVVGEANSHVSSNSMQQYEFYPGLKSRSGSRKGRVNSSDRNYSGTRPGNQQQSPRFRNVPDAPPDPYRNVQDKLYDRYKPVQDKWLTDRYRYVQGKSSPDRYRNVQNKSLPDSSKNVPEKSLPDSSRKVPEKSLPDSSKNVPEKSLPDSSKNVPEKSLPDTSKKVPDKSLPDSSRKVPDKSLPDSFRKMPDKSLPDTSKKVPDKSLPDSFRKMPEKSLPDSSKKVPDKSLPDSSKKVPDKSLPYSSRYVPDKSWPDSSRYVPEKSSPNRYRNVPGNKTSKMQYSLLPSHSNHQEGQSELGSVTSAEFMRSGAIRSPALRSPVIIPPVNMQPVPMTFMVQFPPPHFVPFPPAVKPYETAGITNDTFCDFNQYPSNFPQPSWENYQEMDKSSFCLNPESEPFQSSYSYWTDETIEQPTTLADTSDANLTTDCSIEYADAFNDIQYNAGFFPEPPLIEYSAGHDTAEFHEGYSESNSLNSVQAIQPHFAPMIVACQSTVAPAPVPHGIVSRSFRSFLPHFMQPKTAACQCEKRFHDASTNTQTTATYITASTNTGSDFMMSIGTNTEAAELVAVSTNTDQVEMRTIATNTELPEVPKKEMRTIATNTELPEVPKKEMRMIATNTELSDVMPRNEVRMVAIHTELSDVTPTRETTDPSEVMHQSESGTNFGGAKPKRRPDSTVYDYCRSNEDETVDRSHNISRTSSSDHASSDVMSNPECSSRQRNIQKDAIQREDNSCSGKLHSADLKVTSKTKRNLAPKSDLDEVYYSDESSASEIDEMVKERRVSSDIHKPNDRDRFSVLGSPDFFPKWAGMVDTNSSSPLSPPNTVFNIPLPPDLTKLQGSPTGNLKLSHSTSPFPEFSLFRKAENQTFPCSASSPGSVASGLSSAAPSLRSSLPLSPFMPECFPESAGDASFVNSILIENSALTRQIMMLLLKVNPLFALDPPAHRLATFKELMLVKRCQFDMKLLQQRQKVSETRLQHHTAWDDPQTAHNNESPFGKTAVKEQELSNRELDQCVQQAGFNPTNVPQRQQNLHRLEGWSPQYLENERLLQKQPPQPQHVQPGQHKIYTSSNDLQTSDESYLKPDNEKITSVGQNHPYEEMEEKPFRQLRQQRRMVSTKEGNSYWRDRFARQKAGDWPQTPNTSEIQNEEHNSEKISELSEITVEDMSTKTQGSSDEETWQKVCRKKKTVKTLKETGPKKFSRR